MRSYLKIAAIMAVLTGSLGLAGQSPADGTPFGIAKNTFVVRLLSPISTTNSKEGDMFTALVVEPEEYRDAVFEGTITKLKAAPKGAGKGKAEVAFHFDTLTAQGRTSPVSSDLQEVTNVKGAKGVDEEGHVIAKGGGTKKFLTALGAGAAGAALGAVVGGAKGAVVGAGLGVTAGLLIALEFTANGPNLEFVPGTLFRLEVSDRAKGK